MYSKLVCGLALAVGAMGRPDGAGHGGHGGHSGASQSFSAPASSYSQPAADNSGYNAPADNYAQPATGYGVQDSGAGYDSGYGVSSYGAEEEPFNIATLIIPLLVIAGLSLLFPTITTVEVDSDGNKRRKRDVNPMVDVVERVNDIYSSVVASEECMERIACEVGGLAKDVGLTHPAVRMAEGFVPSKYKSYYSQFASGKDCQKIKCGALY